MWHSGSRNRRHNDLHRDSWGERESEEAPLKRQPKAISSVTRQLSASPMMVFAVRIEDVLDATVQRPHDADPRKHRRPAKCRDQDQGFRRSLPLRSLMLSLRKLGDVPAGILERDELATAGQRDRAGPPSGMITLEVNYATTDGVHETLVM
jgi:hypothetical protein